MGHFRIVLIAGLLLTALTARAQTDPGKPVPPDPEVRIGVLSNGITYYIRNNSEPPGRASFYLIQNVGANLEEDHQDGIAHYLEHMAFNGTRHFPGNTLISRLERHGVAFGRNINAYTAHNETVYNLSDIPVNREGLIDTCLLILHDWSDYLLIDEDEVESERGVIREEWRTRLNASFRLYLQYYPILLKGSRYADRDIIGSLDVINSVTAAELRAFYDKWYRTDLQTIVVVGDIDTDEMEEKITELFSTISPPDDIVPRPFFEVPEHSETLYVLATDPEAPQNQISLYIKHRDAERDEKNLGYMRELMVTSLMNNIISSRFQEMLQRSDPPFIAGGIGVSGLVRGYDALYMNAAINPGQGERAMEVLYREAERIRRHGFTESELERERRNYLTAFKNRYNQRDKIHNEAYIYSIQDYHLAGEPMPSLDFRYSFIKEFLPGITVEDLNNRFRSVMTPENRVLIVMGEEREGISHLTEQQFHDIVANVENSDIEPYRDRTASGELIPYEPPGSAIIEERDVGKFDAVEWKLENGARVIYRKASYNRDQVTLSAFSLGGTSLYEKEMLPSASFLPMVVDAYGAGEYDAISLQRLLTGKQLALSLTLTETIEGFSGSSRPADFETLMQLLYLRFCHPRFDAEAHSAIMSRYRSLLTTMDNDPSKRMQDSLAMILTNYSERTVLQNLTTLEKVSMEKIEMIYRDRFRNAGEFTFIIVGNIESDIVRPLVEKYIGSLPSGESGEAWVDRRTRHPEGEIERSITLPLTVPKATVFVSYSGKMDYNSPNNLTLKVIQNILQIEYTRKVREEEGGTYGVSMNITSHERPHHHASALIMFDCDPDNADYLKSIVYREIERLINDGPDQGTFGKAVENLLKTREESRQQNRYWSNAIYAYYLTGIDNNDPANYEELLKNMTPEDVKRVAGLFFGNAGRAEVIFRPN